MAEVRIVIRGDNRAHAAMQEVARDLAQAAGAADKLTAELVDTSDKLGKAGGAAGGAGTGIRGLASEISQAQSQLFFFTSNLQTFAQVGQQALALLQEGAVAVEVGEAFQAQLGVAGESVDEWVATLRAASGSTIDDTTLMKTAMMGMSLGVTQDVDEMAQLLEIARFKARRFGRDTSDAFNDIAIGIGRLTPRILDNLGIIIEEEAVYGAYAESIGKVADKLTEVEKRQAVVNEIIRQGSAEIEAAGGMADTAADHYRRFSTGIENTKSATLGLAGVALSPVLNEWATSAQATADALSKNEILGRAVQFAVAGAAGEWDRAGEILAGHFTPEVEAGTDAASQAAAIAEAAALGYRRMADEAGAAADGAYTLNDALSVVIPNLAIVKGLLGEGAGLVSSSEFMADLGKLTPNAIFQDATESLREATLKAGLAETLAPQFAQLMGISLEEAWEHVSKTLGVKNVFAQNKLESERLGRKMEADQRRAAAEAERAWKASFEEIKGAARQALSLDVSVKQDDFLLEKFGLRLPDPAEMGRRLADIAAKGEESPFIGMFSELAGKGGEEAKALATRMLMDFQAGLRPDLIDKGAAKEMTKRLLIGQANMDQIADEIANELINEGFAPEKVQQALGVQFGGTVNNVTQLTDGLGGSVGDLTDKVTDFLDTTGADWLTFYADLKKAVDDVIASQTKLSQNMNGGTGGGGVDAGPGFQHGADFIVPAGFSGDRFPMRVSSGERVIVIPPGRQRQQGAAGNTFVYSPNITQSTPVDANQEFQIMRFAFART